MFIERSNYTARRFEPALAGVQDSDERLVEALIRPLEPATAFFRAQREEGFYGGLPAGSVLPENGDSPYTIIRTDGRSKAMRYSEIEPYRTYLRDIARRMDDAIGVANDTSDPQRNLIEASLRPRALALKRGAFDEAMVLGVNTRQLPRFNLFVGLLDRYLDPRGLKLVMQGWLQKIDSDQDRHFNDLARQIVRNPALWFRVIYGDMLAAGGMTIDKIWSGNTVPSEDNIRGQVGADSYVFPNNMDTSTRKIDIPAVRKYMPQVTQTADWEETMLRAKKIAITAHEIGHALVPFGEGTIKLLDGNYMALKELLAELFAVKEIEKLPESLISLPMKELIYARSLAVWRTYIDLFHQETDPDAKAVLAHYARAGVWRTNYQERTGVVRVTEEGTMEITDWGKFVENDRDLYHEVISAINNERYLAGYVERVIRINSLKPRVYGNPHSLHLFSPQVAIA